MLMGYVVWVKYCSYHEAFVQPFNPNSQNSSKWEEKEQEMTHLDMVRGIKSRNKFFF